MSNIQNHPYVSPEAKKLLAAYAKHTGESMGAVEAWVLDAGIRRIAAQARNKSPGGWAGTADKKRAAPGRKDKRKGAK